MLDSTDRNHCDKSGDSWAHSQKPIDAEHPNQHPRQLFATVLHTTWRYWLDWFKMYVNTRQSHYRHSGQKLNLLLFYLTMIAKNCKNFICKLSCLILTNNLPEARPLSSDIILTTGRLYLKLLPFICSQFTFPKRKK